MNVSLTPELERFIAQQVDSGRYRAASEVVRDAVRLLQTQLEERAAKLEALRVAVEVGLAELDRGEGLSAEDAVQGSAGPAEPAEPAEPAGSRLRDERSIPIIRTTT